MESVDNQIDYAESPPASKTTVFRLAAIGELLAVTAIGLGAVETEQLQPVRVILSVLGLLVVGGALTLRYRWPIAWLMTALVALTARFGLPGTWDSFRLATTVFAGVAVIGACFAALPVRGRMALASGLALLHFGGIFVAVSSPPQTPYWISQAWTYFYRPYLQFTYLSNAYHFYSPDPGPATELWFCIEYAARNDDPVCMEIMQTTSDGKPLRDGTGEIIYKPMTNQSGQPVGEPIKDARGNLIFNEKDQLDRDGNTLKRPIYEDPEEQKKPKYLPITYWVKLPRRERDFKDPLGQTYYRRLGLTEYAAQNAISITELPEQQQHDLTERRVQVKNDFPILTNWPIAVQCKIPSPMTETLIFPSYVRYIATKYAHSPFAEEGQADQRPPREIASIKVYRVLHWIADPPTLIGRGGQSKNDGINLKDPTTYLPYYMGEFDREGELVNKNDPMLYWLLPIVRRLNEEPNPRLPTTLTEYNRRYEDFVFRHAGSHHMQGELAP